MSHPRLSAEHLYRPVLEVSTLSPVTLDVSPATTVAFQGELGAYADLAIDRAWGAGADRLPCRDFVGVVHAVSSGAAPYGVLPYRNSIIGEIPGVAQALASADLQQHVFVDVPVVHCLLGTPGSTIRGITMVWSHPAALGQCQRFFSAHPWLTPVAGYDTAGSARDVGRRQRPTEGAIADAGCAARYGLVVLDQDIADQPDNTTRFVIVSRPGQSLPLQLDQ